MAERHPATGIIGTDISDALLKTARLRAGTLPNVTFAAANGAMLPFADNVFDTVRIDQSLQHAERPDQVIIEMTRVAKHGGVVLAAEPDWGTFVLYNDDDKTSNLLVAAIGLVTCNTRNDQLYDELVGRAASIERKLGLPDGAFANRPYPWLSIRLPGINWKVDHRTGVGTIYRASIAL